MKKTSIKCCYPTIFKTSVELWSSTIEQWQDVVDGNATRLANQHFSTGEVFVLLGFIEDNLRNRHHTLVLSRNGIAIIPYVVIGEHDDYGKKINDLENEEFSA